MKVFMYIIFFIIQNVTYSQNENIEELINKLAKADLITQNDIILTLGKNHNKSASAVPFLIEIITNLTSKTEVKSDEYITSGMGYSFEHKVRCNAIWALGEMRSEAIMAVPILFKILQENNIQIHCKTLISLSKISPNSISVTFALINALEKNDPMLKYIAVECLSKQNIKLAIPSLINLLQNNDSKVREHVARVLGQFQSPTVISALLQALNDSNETVKIKVIDSLQKLGVEVDSSIQIETKQKKISEEVIFNKKKDLKQHLIKEKIKVKTFISEKMAILLINNGSLLVEQGFSIEIEDEIFVIEEIILDKNMIIFSFQEEKIIVQF